MHADTTAESQQSYRRTLRYAEAIAGGMEPLASRLGVSSFKVQAWAEGWDHIPDSIFLFAVDIICEASDDDLMRARNYRPALSDASRAALFGR